jgi:hypothetical protein
MRYVNLTPAAVTQIAYKAFLNQTHDLHKVDLGTRKLTLSHDIPPRKVRVDLGRIDRMRVEIEGLRKQMETIGGQWSIEVVR